MAIFCNRELIESIQDINFPTNKNDLLSYVERKGNVSEASWISLNKLKDKTYKSIDEICENIKIVCNLEIMEVLKEIDFPVTKEDLLDHIRFRNFSESVSNSVENLPDNFLFRNITDICK